MAFIDYKLNGEKTHHSSTQILEDVNVILRIVSERGFDFVGLYAH